MSQSVDLPQTNQVGHNNNNNTKVITNPLALSLLIGLNNNNKNKRISDSDFVRSPKSPLELRVLSTMAEPFSLLRSLRSSSIIAHLNCFCCGPTKVGLSIVDSLGDDRVLSPDIVFGPALRIKSSEIKEKHLKIEKERSSGVVFEIGENSSDTKPLHCLRKTRVLPRPVAAEGDNAFSGCVSKDDMEMSEEYTCIIAHGPNPKTTHIYGDRALECDKNEFKRDDDTKENYFLSFCDFCNKKLKDDDDIYMYREKAFCSEECRVEEMITDEEDMEDSCIVMHESLKIF